MKFYELTYLISPELKEEEIKKVLEKINSFIQEEGGTTVKSGNPTPKTLAYPIKKQRAAFWGSLDFYLLPEKIDNLKEKLKKDSQILRFLLVSKLMERKFAKAPVLAKTKGETPTAKKEEVEKKVDLKEIEKKLEEILGEGI